MNDKELVKKIINMVKIKYPKELLIGYFKYKNKYIFTYMTESDDIEGERINGRYYVGHYSSRMIEYNKEKDSVEYAYYPQSEWWKIKKTQKFNWVINLYN